jgi:CheY-like chemotaxis protein
MQHTGTVDLVAAIGSNLPYLRRYARALTGNQTTGDNFAAATLETVLQDTSILKISDNRKVALYHAFHLVWASAGAPVGEADTRMSAVAQGHMAGLTPNTREALLLNVLEGFSHEEIAAIMQLDSEDVSHLTKIALEEMERSVAGRVMIIEDEAIIAMHLSAILADMGHSVTGIAATRTEAVDLAARDRPDLILADVQLADKSSGIDAVNDILAQFDHVPVIFITAFPERLLTGTRPEPAFLISKPFTEDQVFAAVSQALFFSRVEA